MVTTVPCLSCGREVAVEVSWIRAAHREDREFMVWCGRRCQLRYVSIEGTRQVASSFEQQQREDLIRAGHLDSNERGEFEASGRVHRGDRQEAERRADEAGSVNGRSDQGRLW